MNQVISVRLSEAEIERLARMKMQTGWTSSQIIRQLLGNAVIQPAVIRTEVERTATTATPEEASCYK